MLKFLATVEQVKQIASNACQASTSVGMGYLHFNINHTFKAEDFTVNMYDKDEPAIHLDYVKGRMVKLAIHLIKEVDAEQQIFEWSTSSDINPEYQSWTLKYDTFNKLVSSVGAKVIV